jgi:subtilisin-like proprotein convertase family protein
MVSRCLLPAGLGLLALPAFADDVHSFGGVIRHMYYKPATGEVHEIFGVPREGPNIVWDSTLDSGLFRDLPSTNLALDWGDLDPLRLGVDPGGTDLINGFTYGFVTNGTQPPTVNIALFGTENGHNSTGRTPIAKGSFTVPGTGSPTQGVPAAFTVTVDLEGGLEVPVVGPDLDGDRKRDFGYTYWMQDRANATLAGPIIATGQPVDPPNQPGAPGAEDSFDLFANPLAEFDPSSSSLGAGTTYSGTVNNGGNPFAQFYFKLWSDDVLPLFGGCCMPDGTCEVIEEEECDAEGGSYLGNGVFCVHPGDQLSQNTHTVNLPIPDGLPDGGDGIPVSDTIHLAGAFNAGIFEIDVNIPDHTYISDLRITLTHNGITAVLWDDECGSNDGLTVTFTDVASVVQCGSPVTGSIRPREELETRFEGPPAGGWTLTVVDTYGDFTGTWVSWAIRARDAIANCAPPCACPGDFDGDNAIGLQDLALILASYAGPPSNPCMDVDEDDSIGLSDLAAFLSHFGTSCP